MLLHDTVTLNNGIVMPKIAFGTSQIEKKEVSQKVALAIQKGFLHIDTAQNFNNEAEVANGIILSGAFRRNIFITTHIASEIKNYIGAKYSVEKSLEKLKTNYIDLLLIHAPIPLDESSRVKRFFKENLQVWKAMEDFYDKGIVRAIGLRNFKKEDIKNIVDNCNIPPSVNQINFYPSSTNAALLNYMKRSTELCIQGYFPKQINLKKFENIISKYNLSFGQLCCNFILQENLCAIVNDIEDIEKQNITIQEEDIKILKQSGFNKTLTTI